MKPERSLHSFIITCLMGMKVKQVKGIQQFIGRTGAIKQVITDENGVIHCQMGPDGWWCPAHLLDIEE